MGGSRPPVKATFTLKPTPGPVPTCEEEVRHGPGPYLPHQTPDRGLRARVTCSSMSGSSLSRDATTRRTDPRTVFPWDAGSRGHLHMGGCRQRPAASEDRGSTHMPTEGGWTAQARLSSPTPAKKTDPEAAEPFPQWAPHCRDLFRVVGAQLGSGVMKAPQGPLLLRPQGTRQVRGGTSAPLEGRTRGAVWSALHRTVACPGRVPVLTATSPQAACVTAR